MKKLSLVMLGLLATQLAAREINFSCDYHSEHVSCGSKSGQQKQESRLVVSDAALGGLVEVGLDVRTPFDGDISSKAAPYVAYVYDVCGDGQVGMAYQAYFYGNTTANKHANELRLFVSGGGCIDMGADVSFNFEERDFTASANVGKTFDLQRYGLKRCSLGASVEFGYDHSARLGGDKQFFAQHDGDVGYFYYGSGLRLTYAYNPNLSLRAGVQLAGNASSKKSWANELGHHRNLFWFTSGVAATF
ncbi:MAG: hypothetical protein LBC42_01565 [Puniceicoccales bacterium]|jgi:hypothetical protein|nr:hypothetical protein [Puniceicoccales bacterium]